MLYSVYNIYRRKGVHQRDNTADLNDPNMYVRDVVAMFKFFAKAHPLMKFFFTPPLCHCAGAAQPYTYLCVCSGSLLTQSK